MPDFVPDTPEPEPPEQAGNKRGRRAASQRADAKPTAPQVGSSDLDGPEPPRLVNGQPNRAFYVYQYGLVNRLMFNALRAGQALPFNYDSATKGILAEAKMAGIDPDRVVDNRGEEAVLADALDRYRETPEAIWEDEDATLRIVKERFDGADQLVIENLQGRMDAEEMRALEKKLHRLRDRVSLVLSLRDRARKPLPDGYSPIFYHQYAAANLLRFMLYVGRSNIPSDEPGGTVFKIGRHHAKIAWDIYEAQRGIHIKYNRATGKTDVVVGAIPYKGAIIVAPPGHGKPLSVETPVLMADGLYRKLGEIQVGDRVISHTGAPRNVSEVHKQGVLKIVKIVTESGREVDAALDHPFLTPEGWVNAGDLVPGQSLALVPNVQCDEHPAFIDECRLAGYFVGDGNTTRGNTSENCRISCAEPEIQQEILRCADSMGFSVRCKPSRSAAAEMLFSSRAAKPREWAKNIGISARDSHSKRVPEFVFKAGPRGIGAFLAAYFECDGHVNMKGNKREDCCVEFYSVNRDLLVDTQRLLLRLGIHSGIRLKNGRYRGENHQSWRLSFASRDEVAKFLDRVPVVGPKRARLEEWSPNRMRFDSEFISDRIKSVEPAGASECRCLTVDVDHTFLANDLVVHNTELVCHFTAREICRNPETQAIMLHAISEKAQANLRYVANCFNRANSVGRRCMALFPIELAQSNNQKMRVKLDRPLNQSTLEAYGFMSGRLGINTSLQIWDDIVPQSDINEEATRQRRFDRMGGTWSTRQRGEKTFVLCIGTLWHHADAVMRQIEKVKAGHINWRVSIQKCGGPKETPMFYPLWPEVYGKDYLKGMFSQLGPNLYSAAYQSNPRSDSARIVRRLRFYDPTTKAHAEFRKRAVSYLSLDPSGTNRAHSDKSGLVYAAAGELAAMSEDGDSFESRQIVRIVDAKEFGATQTDLVEYVSGYAANNATDYVLVEQAGMSAIADMLREFYGVNAIPMSVGQKNKEIRLRNVAPMLDEGQSDNGGPTACVEFPGVVVGTTKNGTPVLGPDPAFKWLYDQILDFGVAANDHALDAVTQLCLHLKGDLRPGMGSVTEQVHRIAAMSTIAQAKQAVIKSCLEQDRVTPDEDDVRWFTGSNQGGW